MISVRPAQAGDGVLLLQMTRVLAEHHGWPEKVVAKAEDYECHLFGEHPIVFAQIALSKSGIAGAAVWHRSFSTNRGKEIAYLEDLTVLPEFRGHGVGKRLMQAVAADVLARGLQTVWWQAEGWNAKALNFYESLGAKGHANVVIWQVNDAALKTMAGVA